MHLRIYACIEPRLKRYALEQHLVHVDQDIFFLHEINQMEREMCSCLERVLSVQHLEFEVQAEFGSDIAPAIPVATFAIIAT